MARNRKKKSKKNKNKPKSSKRQYKTTKQNNRGGEKSEQNLARVPYYRNDDPGKLKCFRQNKHVKKHNSKRRQCR